MMRKIFLQQFEELDEALHVDGPRDNLECHLCAEIINNSLSRRVGILSTGVFHSMHAFILTECQLI
ncbi:MAG: hypothetical protein ACU4EQ_06720 [Candidatus Nitrosoglobus sp.]